MRHLDIPNPNLMFSLRIGTGGHRHTVSFGHIRSSFYSTISIKYIPQCPYQQGFWRWVTIFSLQLHLIHLRLCHSFYLYTYVDKRTTRYKDQCSEPPPWEIESPGRQICQRTENWARKLQMQHNQAAAVTFRRLDCFSYFVTDDKLRVQDATRRKCETPAHLTAQPPPRRTHRR